MTNGMPGRYVLSDYLEEALTAATYDKLEDGSYAGTIPPGAGVVAFGMTLIECEHSLRSTLEDWLLLGLRLGHPLPGSLQPEFAFSEGEYFSNISPQ